MALCGVLVLSVEMGRAEERERGETDESKIGGKEGSLNQMEVVG